MKYRHLLSIVCILLAGITTASGQHNTLEIPDVSVAKGKTISLPVNMDNTADVVAVQFTLTVPDGITVNTSSATLTERSDEHSVTFKSIAANKYMAMIFSSKNNAIKGRTGKLLSVSLTASSALEEGSVHSLALSDVVLGSRDGSNLATGFSAGQVTIAKSPDLEVGQVEVSETTVMPGEKINVRWTVTNKGGMPTTAGWSEQVFLKNDRGITKLLGTLYYDGTLNPDGVVSRKAEINIPTVLGIDGNCHVQVKLIPNSNSGEPSWMLGNNTAESTTETAVYKTLMLTPETSQVEESTAGKVRFQLTRSGNTATAETFGLTRDADGRIVLPETITIEQGNSSVYFYAQVTANGILDDRSDVRFNITGNGYPETSSCMNIEDDTYPSLSISTDAQDVTEGGSMRFTVSTQRASDEDIEIKMTSDYAARFRIPASISIPAKQTSVDVIVEAVEDEAPHAEEVVTFTVAAANHNPASINTVLVDNDVPTLQLEITPDAVSEAAGPMSLTAKLRRTNNIDKVVTVKLSDDASGGIYYGNQTITLEKGVQEVVMNLGPIDNAVVDGERIYHITAAVWIASCSCNASSGASGGIVTVPLTIYDNDGPTLAVTSSSSIMKEGGEMTLYVKRNTDSESPLTVSIGSDHDGDLEYPSQVTIPSGETEASFIVKSKSNETTDDGFTAVMHANAEGFATGNIWFAVSDQTMPDAQIKVLKPMSEEYYYDDNIIFAMQIANTGNADLPSNTLVRLFKSGDNNAVADYYTTNAIPAGSSTDVEIAVKPSLSIGSNSFYAKVNPDKESRELNYTNNTSSFASVRILSPFTTTTNVQKAIVGKNEKIQISGKAVGRQVADAEIDVYVINKGYRHVITTKTDAEGSFAVDYQPFEKQSGHFIVGSCFHGDQVSTEQCSFDIYAIDVTNSSLTCDITNGESFTGKFYLSNNGVLPLHNVKASLLSSQANVEVTFSDASLDLSGGETKELAYTIKGLAVSPSLAWQTIKMSFVCDEGVTSTSDINYYIREPKAQLKADVASINTSVTIGSSRELLITLSNAGKSETGRISFSTPSWMRVDGVQTLHSLSMGEQMEVALIISTTEQMQANVPVTGNIAINCDNGNGISIPFNIEPVSSQTGVLSIDVCDQFTYYTNEAPHVSGANVVVKHPTTDMVIATGTTNEAGVFEVELPEGYYAIQISADRHETYTNNVYVDPERTRSVVVNLGYTAVSYTWNVEPTEIADEYKLVTKVNYETNVPLPVVVLGVPEKIDGDNMKAGESTLIYVTATNKGLVTALNNTIILPENTDEWMFEPLVSLEPFDLASQQSVVIPVRITRIKDNSISRKVAKSIATDMMGNFSNCMVHVKDTYGALCGDDLKNNESIERMSMKMCAMAATGATIYQYLSNYFGGSGSAGGSAAIGSPSGGSHKSETSSTNYTPVSERTFNMCDTCDAKKAEDLFEVLIGKTFLAPVNEGMNEAYKLAKDPKNQEKQRVVVNDAGLKALRESLQEAAKAYAQHRTGLNVSDLWDLGQGFWDIIKVTRISSQPCPNEGQDNTRKAKSVENDQRSWQTAYNEVAAQEADYLENYYNILLELFGDATWLGYDFENKLSYAVSVAGNAGLSEEDILSMHPSSVTPDQAIALYKRINGLDATNAIDASKLEELVDKNIEMDEKAVAAGFQSLGDQFVDAYNVCAKMYQQQSSSVCASISLQFSQKMVMTRQAFRGTLTVFNGNESTAMTDVKLSLVVKDEDGNVATSHEFQINPESLNGFEGQLNLDGGWTLDPNQTGVATVLFIPTKYAAPTVEKMYSFGGSLSYVDPFTGLKVTRDLTPITLAVKPSPNLDLAYFMQRDVRGDDPLTEEIESSEEAEFSLLIHNTGYGDATNVRMFTEQPEIIDNEKGLAIDFELISSQLNGGDKVLALGGTVATDFGTIPAKSTAYAQWWFKSSLLGHFSSYDVEATHVSSYGNPDLTLLNEVAIHELIRSLDVESENEKLVGFMTNDIADAEDTPDMLYLSNGDIQSVSKVRNAEISKISDTDYQLTVQTGESGWCYGHISDPTYGLSTLKSVVRKSDGKEIPLRNFWQTDRTLRDGKDPLYENRIHFADCLADGNGETYILTFEPVPGLLLEVASIENVPVEGGLCTEPVQKVHVMFNKYIDSSTFTTDDITLAVQGVKQNVESVVVSTEDNKVFTLDFTALNKTVGNGYFVLTVNTDGVKDAEGYSGKNGKQAGWIMFREGIVGLNTSTEPAGAGTIRMIDNVSETNASEQQAMQTALYGSSFRMASEANKGYQFKNWTVNGEVVSTDEILEYKALEDMDIIAHYSAKTYSVTVSDNEGGVIAGSASGFYSYGDILNITAQANEDFVFEGWNVNGKIVSEDENLSIIVDEQKEINAVFRRDMYSQSLTVSRGWNWVSTYVNEPVPVSVFLNHVSHIVGQFDELINDPEYGMTGGIDWLLPGLAYKVDASYSAMRTFKGHLHNIADTPIMLHTGWNWISYPYTEERNIGNVLTNASEGDCITSQYGFAEYANGYWEGTLNTLAPGLGYIYKSVADKDLGFDFTVANNSKASVYNASYAVDDVPSNIVDVHQYPSTMSVISRISANSSDIDNGQYRIYAFAGNECRGGSCFIGGKHYLTVYGDDATDISFVIENTVSGDTYLSQDKLTFCPEVIGSRKSPYVISISEATGINSVNADVSRKMRIYSIEGVMIDSEAGLETIQKLNRGIYIIDGQKFIVK